MTDARVSWDRPDRAILAAGLGVLAAGLIARIGRQRRVYSFRNRSVVITGGARGFGFALARRLAREGARLSLVARTRSELERARFQLQARGADVAIFECDVRDETAVRHAIEQVVGQRGRLDVLVNNAGV
ncbi:MAG TPA: SDR family NAD(P)-dependent oxidoreductase, partial [Vicinamibacterales bacterium]